MEQFDVERSRLRLVHPQEIVRTTIRTWQAERPDLDFASMDTVLRLATAAKLVVERSEAALAPLGISLGEFDVLATVRRHGAGAVLTPAEIAELAMVSPSGLTNRMNRLEAAGLLVRTMDPSDRRRFLVSLTRDGTRLADRAVAVLADLDDQLVPERSDRTHQQLASFLDALIERSASTDVSH